MAACHFQRGEQRGGQQIGRDGTGHIHVAALFEGFFKTAGAQCFLRLTAIFNPCLILAAFHAPAGFSLHGL